MNKTHLSSSKDLTDQNYPFQTTIPVNQLGCYLLNTHKWAQVTPIIDRFLETFMTAVCC